MVAYSAAGPGKGKIMFYPLNPETKATVNSKSTANGYGHWFNAKGAVTSFANGYLYSELNASSLTFNIGQNPGKVKQGENYTIGQALRYKDASGNEATASFIFRIHITNTEYGANLVSIDYNVPTGIQKNVFCLEDADERVYDLQGRRLTAPQRGFNIINHRKILVKQ